METFDETSTKEDKTPTNEDKIEEHTVNTSTFEDHIFGIFFPNGCSTEFFQDQPLKKPAELITKNKNHQSYAWEILHLQQQIDMLCKTLNEEFRLEQKLTDINSFALIFPGLQSSRTHPTEALEKLIEKVNKLCTESLSPTKTAEEIVNLPVFPEEWKKNPLSPVNTYMVEYFVDFINYLKLKISKCREANRSFRNIVINNINKYIKEKMNEGNLFPKKKD